MNIIKKTRPVRVLILGVNGFIGNALTDRLLQDDRYIVHGMDLQNDKIQRLLKRDRFEFEEGDIPVPDWQTLRLKRYRKLFGKETAVEDARYPVITYGTMGAIADFKLDLKRNRISRFLRGFAEIEVDTKELMRVCPPVNPPLFKYEDAKQAEKKSALPPLLALVAEVIEENGYTADNIPENKVVERALIKKAKEKGFEFASENQIQEAARLANGWGLQTVGRRGKGRPAKR